MTKEPYRSNRMLELEKEHGEPIEKVLAEAFAIAGGNWTKAAVGLGIRRGTLELWVLKLGLREKHKLVLR